MRCLSQRIEGNEKVTRAKRAGGGFEFEFDAEGFTLENVEAFYF